MRVERLALVILILFPVCAWAQEGGVTFPDLRPAPVAAPLSQGSSAIAAPGESAPAGEVLQEPICFTVQNRAPYTVFGSVMSDQYQTPSGTIAHHRSNFRLKKGEMTEFCTTGPFFEGRRLELTLRTLVPVFSCRTKLTQPLIIQGRLREDGTTQSWVDCL